MGGLIRVIIDNPGIPLFRIMRALWGGHETGRPMLALLLALARDPLAPDHRGAGTRDPEGKRVRGTRGGASRMPGTGTEIIPNIWVMSETPVLIYWHCTQCHKTGMLGPMVS